MKSFKLGEIVKSKAGRDKDSYYLVNKIIDAKYIEVVDGNKRKIKNPKKKNIKHLEKTGYIAEELKVWLENGKRVRNEDIKLVIKDFEDNKEAK
ncbi:MAG TPA: hypothetical protein VJ881_11230 [Halanaerobiales bacterium]|nr:hypothetical protein [Halanaerobiales bacterium]